MSPRLLVSRAARRGGLGWGGQTRKGERDKGPEAALTAKEDKSATFRNYNLGRLWRAGTLVLAQQNTPQKNHDH